MFLKFNSYYFIITCFLFLVELTIAFTLKDGFIRFTVGDYLASILLYCFIRSITKFKPLQIAVITLFVSYSIEGLQFINILQILNLEKYTTTKVLFGTSFSYEDLIAYTFGTITIYFIDKKTLTNDISKKNLSKRI